MIADKDSQEFYNGYFYRFYACIDVVNDDRNTMTDKEKKKYIRYILHIFVIFCTMMRFVMQWSTLKTHG